MLIQVRTSTEIILKIVILSKIVKYDQKSKSYNFSNLIKNLNFIIVGTIFLGYRMLKILYSNHEIFSNQDLVFAHKDLKIDNLIYDSYTSHYLDSLKQCNISTEMIKEMMEQLDSKKKYIV